MTQLRFHPIPTMGGHRQIAVAETPVTNEQYAVFTKDTGRTWSCPAGQERHPVTGISWYDAKAFCQWASQRSGRQIVLPTEQEWGIAAGSDPPEAELGDYAWYSANAGGGTHPVGQKKANEYGLFDMRGNVWEWTASPWTQTVDPDGDLAPEVIRVDL